MKLSTCLTAAVVAALALPALAAASNARAGDASAPQVRFATAEADAPSTVVTASHRTHRRHHSSIRWGIGLGWGGWWGWDPWGYNPYWSYGPGWGYGPGYYGPGGYPRVYPNPSMRHGALDIDVSPERAEIWVDGRRLGVADDFDGFPTYLWLEKGTYDVAIYLDGFRTLARQYTIYPGLVIDVEDRLEPGDAVRPEDLKATSHVNRDERLRRDREAQEEARRMEEGREPPPSDDSREWRPRSRRGEGIDARGEPARVHLEIAPEDASVYLDGRFIGTGRELARLRSGLIVDAGLHTIEVVRPGYEPTERSIEVEPGGEERIDVELEERPGGGTD